MHEGGASNEAAGGESMELLLAAVSSLDGGEVIDANEQLASVASESARFTHWQWAIVELEQVGIWFVFGNFKATLQNKDASAKGFPRKKCWHDTVCHDEALKRLTPDQPAWVQSCCASNWPSVPSWDIFSGGEVPLADDCPEAWNRFKLKVITTFWSQRSVGSSVKLYTRFVGLS